MIHVIEIQEGDELVVTAPDAESQIRISRVEGLWAVLPERIANEMKGNE